MHADLLDTANLFQKHNSTCFGIVKVKNDKKKLLWYHAKKYSTEEKSTYLCNYKAIYMKYTEI